MRNLTEQDFKNIIGVKNTGYAIIKARPVKEDFEDSVGIALGKNAKDMYVTWLFNLTRDEQEFDFYWGHYLEDAESALEDFNTRNI